MLDRFASEQMIGLTSECVIGMPRNIQLYSVYLNSSPCSNHRSHDVQISEGETKSRSMSLIATGWDSGIERRIFPKLEND
jgi:hypothetical protein